MKLVRFKQGQQVGLARYNCNEVAGIDRDQAYQLVRSGIAEYVPWFERLWIRAPRAARRFRLWSIRLTTGVGNILWWVIVVAASAIIAVVATHYFNLLDLL